MSEAFPKLLSVREFCDRNRARDTWPSKVLAVYHMWKKRDNLPPEYRRAFLKIGGKLLIDERLFFEAVARNCEEK